MTKCITSTWREIFDPNGSNISQDSRYINYKNIFLWEFKCSDYFESRIS